MYAPTLSEAEHAAVATVEAFRAALRRADADEVQALRWLAPRPPGERDLLSDLAAAEGVETAVRRLARFWRRADVRLEHVRTIGGLEAEIYERAALPDESLPILTVVRRIRADGPWRVVCTSAARDERFALWIPSGATGIDDVAWSRRFATRFGAGAELVMDGASGVLGDPERGWLAQVRGPFAPGRWPEGLSGVEHLIELSALHLPEPRARSAQLVWLVRAATVFLEELGGHAAFLPTEGKLVHREALARAAAGALGPEQTVRLWARVVEAGERMLATTGLRTLGLPEVEASVEPLGDATAEALREVAARLVEAGSTSGRVGSELVIGHRVLQLVPGRRGPRPGRSYGRWGALSLIERRARPEPPKVVDPRDDGQR